MIHEFLITDLVLDQIIQSCKDYMIRPENSFLNETFNSKLDSIDGLTEEERTSTKHAIWPL